MSSDAPQPVWDEALLSQPHAVQDKSARVRAMFNAIAPRYERINRWFSFGRDAAWRKAAIDLAGVGPEDRVLDVACGTGDLARAAASAGATRVVGCDFAHAMLLNAATRPAPRLAWCEADALRLPFRDESFSIVTCAFGVRNFQDLDAGLREFRRVLVPGGRAVVLEFTRPANRWIRGVSELYSSRLMPRLATWAARDRSGAYRYLPRSVVSFAGAEEFCARLRAAGFAHAEAHPRTFGVVTLYLAKREAV